MKSPPIARAAANAGRDGLVLLCLAAVIVTSACNRKNGSSVARNTAPMPVGVVVIEPQPVALSRELPGRTSASRVAEVRARVNGIVLKRLFKEGSDVKEGDVLFQIDPAPYQAALDSARANLERAQAALASAKVQAERYKDLVATHAVSQQAYDDAVARHLSAAADVAAGEAAVRAADINLSYTSVVAPISGRIGRAEVTEGAYVQGTTATLLAVIQQLDPLYVDLTQSAEQVLGLREALASGKLHPTAKGEAQFTVVLDDGSKHPHPGTLQFSDVSVNQTTGTVLLRGLVPNPGTTLLPGMFVRAELDEATDPAAILVPQTAVSRNARGDATVFVVGSDNSVELRTFKTSRTVGEQWLVEDGLKPGDRVIVDHLQKIRPGMPVQPTPEQPASSTN